MKLSQRPGIPSWAPTLITPIGKAIGPYLSIALSKKFRILYFKALSPHDIILELKPTIIS